MVRAKASGCIHASIRVWSEEEMKLLSAVSVPLRPLCVLLQGSKKSSTRRISIFSLIQALITITVYERVCQEHSHCSGTARWTTRRNVCSSANKCYPHHSLLPRRIFLLQILLHGHFLVCILTVHNHCFLNLLQPVLKLAYPNIINHGMFLFKSNPSPNVLCRTFTSISSWVASAVLHYMVNSLQTLILFLMKGHHVESAVFWLMTCILVSIRVRGVYSVSETPGIVGVHRPRLTCSVWTVVWSVTWVVHLWTIRTLDFCVMTVDCSIFSC